jgi:hypothetical protein
MARHHSQVLPLLNFDKTNAIQLLVNFVDRISVADVVRQLHECPRFQHEYLHALFNKDTSLTQKHHELQVALYAEFEPHLLLNFLRQSHYVLEKALEVCKAKRLYREQVFILGRMGNTNDALALIIEKLDDVKYAIEFIVEHGGGDAALWSELVTWCLQRPESIAALLGLLPQHLDTLDARRFITRIPADAHIEGLRDKLTNILATYTLESSLRQGCNTILKTDCVALMHRRHKQQKASVRIDPTTTCQVCEGPMRKGKAEAACVFFCGHAFHSACLQQELAGPASTTPAATGSATASSSAASAAGGMVWGPLGPPRGDAVQCFLCSRRSVRPRQTTETRESVRESR